MDEKDKKIQELEASVKKLTTDLEAEKTGRADDIKKHEKEIATKDAVIKQKTEDIVGARKQSQELKALSEAEKATMNEREIAIHNATLKLQQDQEVFQKQQQEVLEKEVTARRERAIKSLAGEDKELAKKIGDNFKRVIDHDKAQTDEEIAKIAGDAFNMLGTPRPDAVKTALNKSGDGRHAESRQGENFADTAEGKDAAQRMGLSYAQEQQ